MSDTLTRYEGDALSRALSVSGMSPEDLRREAMRAANERDVEALGGLLEAYISTTTAYTRMDRHALGDCKQTPIPYSAQMRR